MTNQTVAITAIIAAILISFFAPAAYFDHKVNACIDAYNNQSAKYKMELDFVTTVPVCVALANGVK
jgi:hypothetical protein